MLGGPLGEGDGDDAMLVIDAPDGDRRAALEGMIKMQNPDVSQTAAAWSSLAGKIYVPHSEA